MKYHEMTKNYFFREFECGLSTEEAAALCFKGVRTIKQWGKGKDIPKECKTLMRRHKRLELSHTDDWAWFKMNNGLLRLPTGRLVTAQEILAGIALLKIQSELEIRTTSKLLRYVRAIARLK